MPAQVNCGYAFWQDGMTVNGLLGRTNHVAATFFNTPGNVIRGGVLVAGGQMAVSAGAGMSVNVATGYAVCPASSGSSAGGYVFGLMSTANLTVATADPTNPRVDLVAAYVNDTGDATGDAFVAVLTGTPTAGANLGNLNGAPAVPSNGISLAYVLVPANASSVTSGNVMGARARTVTQGGILPVALGFQPAGYPGAYMHDTTSGRLMQLPDSGAPLQPVLLPFVPQLVTGASATYLGSGSPSIAAQVSVNCDGNTDLEIHGTWRGYSNSAFSSGEHGVIALYIDGSQRKLCNTYNPNSSAVNGGGSVFHVTASGVDRPSAGSHVVSLQFSDDLGGQISGSPGVPQPSTITGVELYVRAVPL